MSMCVYRLLDILGTPQSLQRTRLVNSLRRSLIQSHGWGRVCSYPDPKWFPASGDSHYLCLEGPSPRARPRLRTDRLRETDTHH